MTIRPEFNVHLLNEQGIDAARMVALVFSDALTSLELLVPPGRELALVVTKLQEAAFFAKRAVALRPENQQPAPPALP